MSVHISEVHTDIRPAGVAQPGGSVDPEASGAPTTDEQWRESAGRVRWHEARTSAHGYED